MATSVLGRAGWLVGWRVWISGREGVPPPPGYGRAGGRGGGSLSCRWGSVGYVARGPNAVPGGFFPGREGRDRCFSRELTVWCELCAWGQTTLCKQSPVVYVPVYCSEMCRKSDPTQPLTLFWHLNSRQCDYESWVLPCSKDSFVPHGPEQSTPDWCHLIKAGGRFFLSDFFFTCKWMQKGRWPSAEDQRDIYVTCLILSACR